MGGDTGKESQMDTKYACWPLFSTTNAETGTRYERIFRKGVGYEERDVWLRIRIRSRKSFRRDVPLPKVIRLELGECFATMVKTRPVYAMMQPKLLPPSASMGVEGESSDSEVLEVMAKSGAKESIGVSVYAVRGL